MKATCAHHTLRTLSLLTAVALATIVAAPDTADARPRPRAKKFTSNKLFGLGIMLGAPTGFSGKYYLSDDTAIDFGVGAIRRFRQRDGVHLHVDYLWHPAVLATAEPFILPIYFGVGGRIFDFNDNDNDDDDFAIGVRAPFGIMFDFNNVPIDIFFEVAVVADFIFGDKSGFFDLNAAVGVRYYF